MQKFFALQSVNVTPSKTSLDAMDIMGIAGGICESILAKDHAVYKK